jgi:hypothetical protein
MARSLPQWDPSRRRRVGPRTPGRVKSPGIWEQRGAVPPTDAAATAAARRRKLAASVAPVPSALARCTGGSPIQVAGSPGFECGSGYPGFRGARADPEAHESESFDRFQSLPVGDGAAATCDTEAHRIGLRTLDPFYTAIEAVPSERAVVLRNFKSATRFGFSTTWHFADAGRCANGGVGAK